MEEIREKEKKEIFEEEEILEEEKEIAAISVVISLCNVACSAWLAGEHNHVLVCFNMRSPFVKTLRYN